MFASQLQEVSPSLPATILMDEDGGSPDDDMSSPREYTLGSPQEVDPDAASPQSDGTHEVTSDVELDA